MALPVDSIREFLQCHHPTEGSEGMALWWLELGQVEQVRLFPIFILTLCRVFLQCLLSSLCCTASLFSSFLWVLDQVGWVFNPSLCPVAELQSAPPWSQLPIHFRFQISDHQAALFSSHQLLPVRRGCSYKPSSKIPLRLVLCQAQPSSTEERAPYQSHLNSFSFCALSSLLLPLKTSKELHCVAEEPLPSCLSAAPAK